MMRFSVFDSDSKSSDLSSHEFIGEIRVTLGEIVSAPGQCFVSQLKKFKGDRVKTLKNNASMVIRSEEASRSRDVLKFTVRAEKVDKKDFFGKSDPFLEFHRLREDNSWVKVHETEIIKNTLNPFWKTISIPLQVICNGDLDRPLKIVCCDWNKNSDPDYIGECQVSVRDLMSSAKYRKDFINDTLKNKKKGYQNSGVLVVQDIVIIENPSFLEYIKGGCKVNLMVAIDFTGSNGDPGRPGTLHYRFGMEPNDYQSAIRTIGDILAPYDSDQKIPVWGFGGRIKGEVSHCFALNFNEADPEVNGVEGILQCYDNAFKYVTLSGPTLFSQIINTATALSADHISQQNQHYSVLLILTDGVINDMEATARSVITACSYPLSIIIVGIGEADFSKMKELDGDEQVLQSGGKKAPRDIVQFVPYKNFANAARLAKETLAEIPRQFLEFMKMKQIKPNPPLQVPHYDDINEMPPVFEKSAPKPTGNSSGALPSYEDLM